MKRIFCFWTGDNNLTPNRKIALDSIKKLSEVDVILTTKDNLPDYILENHPLHKSYNYLSYVHRSDYLRSYFMNFHGGGYSDIKVATGSWNESFNELLEQDDKYALGYKEIGPHGVAIVGGDLQKQLYENWFKLIGCCSFICKPHTPFTEDWHNIVTKILDDNYEKIKAHPGGIWEDQLKWTGIMGDVFHPLCLKYADNLLQNDGIKSDFSKTWR